MGIVSAVFYGLSPMSSIEQSPPQRSVIGDRPYRTTQAAEGLLRRPFSVAEIDAMVAAGIMDEGERVELIGGELVPMTAKGIRHERLKTFIMMELARKLPEDLAFTPETTFRLPRIRFWSLTSSSMTKPADLRDWMAGPLLRSLRSAIRALPMIAAARPRSLQPSVSASSGSSTWQSWRRAFFASQRTPAIAVSSTSAPMRF